MAIEFPPRVVIFDRDPLGYYLDQAVNMSHEEGFVPESFNDATLATKSLSFKLVNGIPELFSDWATGLVATLGQRAVNGHAIETHDLIREAVRLGIPVALLSHKPEEDNHLLGDGRRDMVIPKADADMLTPRLRTWFRALEIRPPIPADLDI